MGTTKKDSQRKLTPKQDKFIDKYIETGNATEAASQVYNCKDRSVANAIGNENLAKPIIQAEKDDRVQVAKNMIYTIATTGEKEETRLRASQDIVDRADGKATQKVEQETKIKVGDLSDEELVKVVFGK